MYRKALFLHRKVFCAAFFLFWASAELLTFSDVIDSMLVQLTVAGHSTFPSVRSKMADPALFPAALNGAYVITCIVVCSIGGVGYWYWGDSAQVREPSNLSTLSHCL